LPPLHPFIPVPGAVRVSLEGIQAGRPWANVFHVQYSGAPPSNDVLASWCTNWYAASATALSNIQTSDSTILQVVGTDLSSVSGQQVTVGAPIVGLLTTAIIPANSAVLINFNSSFRYRGGHPRAYLVGGVQDSTDTPNTWLPGFVDAVNSAYASVFEAFSAGALEGFTPLGQCAVSYKTADAYRTAPLIMPITTYQVNSGIATMRRRMRK
jgi:hypothetical protein